MDPGRFRRSVGRDGHVEYLAQVIQHALLVSKGHRPDVMLTLVLEKSRDYSRAVSFNGGTLGSLSGWDENAILDLLKDVLNAGQIMEKDQSIVFADGVTVCASSFERLVRERTGRLCILDPKGGDIRDVAVPENPVFLLTDHIPMPKNTLKYLARLKAIKLSLGPIMLHASQCITIIHNELDRRHW